MIQKKITNNSNINRKTNFWRKFQISIIFVIINSKDLKYSEKHVYLFFFVCLGYFEKFNFILRTTLIIEDKIIFFAIKKSSDNNNA